MLPILGVNRPNYLLDNSSKPLFRGILFFWLYTYSIWSSICILYAGLAITCGDTDLVAWRLCTSLILYLNCYFSALYHCSDKIYRKGEFDEKKERALLKYDLFILFLLMQCLTNIWSYTHIVNIIQSIVSLAGGLSIYCAKLETWTSKSTVCIQLLQLIQAAISLYSFIVYGNFHSIACIYTLSICIYAVKMPNNNVFGYHEVFHTLCACAHCMHIICDMFEMISVAPVMEVTPF